MAPVRVTVVTGFLGAGKTTLVNAWLAPYRRGEVAVVVNEVGDVGIDGELLGARVRELVEITGGCVCCRTQAELASALETLAARAPARILVETSGAASPAGVVGVVVRGGRDGAYTLDGVVTVVDATRARALAEHDLAVEQIGYADVVVLSRAGLAGEAAIADASSFVASLNGAASVAIARGGRVDGAATLDALLARRTELPPAPRSSEPHAHAHREYESVSLVIAGEIDGDAFADFVEGELGRVSGRIFRIKGILAVAGLDARMIVQGVGDGVELGFGELWGDAPRTSRLVVVGFGLDRAALARGFEACRA